MPSTPRIAALLIAGAASLSACAPPGPAHNNGYNTPNHTTGNNNASSGYGTIDSIQVVRGASSTGGGGAVVGGLLGALLGNQIGSGSGRTAATVAGAVGGAVAGNHVEANRNAPELFQINVRLDNGALRSVTQDSANDLRAGNRIRLVDGRVYRD